MPDEICGGQAIAPDPAAEGHPQAVAEGEGQAAVRQGQERPGGDAAGVQRVGQGIAQATGRFIPGGLEDVVLSGIHGVVAHMAGGVGDGGKGQIKIPVGQGFAEFFAGKHFEYLLVQERNGGLFDPVAAQPVPGRSAVGQAKCPVKAGVAFKAPFERRIGDAHAPADIPDPVGEPTAGAVAAQGHTHLLLEQVQEVPQRISGLLCQLGRGELCVQGRFNQVEDALHTVPPFLLDEVSISWGRCINLARFAGSVNLLGCLDAQRLTGAGIQRDVE